MILPASVPAPDLAVVRGLPHQYRTQHPSAADAALFIEVADSSLDHDRNVKGLIYANAGVPIYWVVNVVALVKDAERYIFLYDNESAPALMQTLGRFAGDPELSFSWYDAAVLSQKVRRLNRESTEERKGHLPARRASR